jgi:hypothetical protein
MGTRALATWVGLTIPISARDGITAAEPSSPICKTTLISATALACRIAPFPHSIIRKPSPDGFTRRHPPPREAPTRATARHKRPSITPSAWKRAAAGPKTQYACPSLSRPCGQPLECCRPRVQTMRAQAVSWMKRHQAPAADRELNHRTSLWRVRTQSQRLEHGNLKFATRDWRTKFHERASKSRKMRDRDSPSTP